MKNAIKTLSLSAVAFCATAAFAANQARVEVPFDFTALGHIYPAGVYRVSSDVNRNFVTLTSQSDASKHLSWSAGPADAISAPAIVRFDQNGSDYALKNIQVGDRVTPNLDKRGKVAVSATTSISGQ